MTFVSSQIKEIERRFGHPDVLSTVQSMTSQEISRVKSTMTNGRSHDVTLFISKGDRFIFIAKPFYPAGLFRAPSGGIHRGEDFIEGAKREAWEETGVEIELLKYILRVNARFESGNGFIDWTSHIFKAEWLTGDINPIDNREISEARLVGLDEIPRFRELMITSGKGGFRPLATRGQETRAIQTGRIDSSSTGILRTLSVVSAAGFPCPACGGTAEPAGAAKHSK